MILCLMEKENAQSEVSIRDSGEKSKRVHGKHGKHGKRKGREERDGKKGTGRRDGKKGREEGMGRRDGKKGREEGTGKGTGETGRNGKREEGRGKREEGRGKREEGRGKRDAYLRGFRSFYSSMQHADIVGLEDIAGEVFVFDDAIETVAYVFSVDFDGLAVIHFGCAERDLFEKFFHDGVEASCADVFGACVDFGTDASEFVDGIVVEVDFEALGFEECDVLFDE